MNELLVLVMLALIFVFAILIRVIVGPVQPATTAELVTASREDDRTIHPDGLDAAPVAAAVRDYPITAVIIGVCVAMFLLLNFSGDPAKEAILRILAPSPFLIWGGAVWGLATSAFVHLAWWHILFNMLCARDFGRAVERDMGARHFVGFVLASCFVSSSWELFVSAATGIGFSGVVYALFGFMLARRHSRPAYPAILTRRTVTWLLGWLIACFVLTVTDVVPIANAAHVAGL